jgi:hypothetical protein
MKRKWSLSGILQSLFGESNKSEKDESFSSHRDYGQELINGHHNSDVIKGTRLVCALDEQTCLKCLELDGSTNPPKLPVHNGCRCVTVPVMKTFKELGLDIGVDEEILEGPRSSAIGQVKSDGGIYKAYLIERAKALENGLDGEALAQHLNNILSNLIKRFPKESRELAAIKTALFAMQPHDDISKIEEILHTISWPSKEPGPLFKCCAENNRFDIIDDTLSLLTKQVPPGPYDPRHKGKLYRSTGNIVKKLSLEKAVKYYEQADAVDCQNTAIMMDLGKLYRQRKEVDKAKKMFHRVLQINPGHKGAEKELSKL